MEIPRNHRELVERLATDVRPVSRLRSPTVRMLAWMAFPALVLAGAALAHLRADLANRLQTPAFALELSFLAAGAGLSTWLAFRVAAPDRRAVGGGLWLALGVVAAAVVALLSRSGGGPPSVSGGFVAVGAGCLKETVMMAVLPWVTLLVALRRAAPVAPATGGALAGVAAFLLANVAMRIICPIDAPWHVLTWHLLPAGVAAILSGALGTTWLAHWALSGRSPHGQRPA